MKAFWWFEENSIAGMARPGFNCTRWFDFPYEQAVLVGWLGRFPSGPTSISDFHAHVEDYGSKILKYYEIGDQAAVQAFEKLKDRDGLLEIFRGVSNGSHLLESYEVIGDQIHFQFSQGRLNWEIDFLKRRGIDKIVSLTENHNSKESLERHFDAFHFSINDLEAPTFDQVHQLAGILRDAKEKSEKVAVHCLAGIGRTSTMLISAHLVLGEKLETMKTLIARQNPVFAFSGRQSEFIHSVAEKHGAI